ncbi:intraflagellar transport protein 25 homolog [Symsagittifera roscoffensis]|uniref:intraflagellar transport protein 25 homolog n=1 Tax=Symsagittifera roscoffensis TaxID=84072 RepID=UPI00307CC69A
MVRWSNNAEVVLASSSCPDHPPESTLDGAPETFWLSTGMFPQTLLFQLPDATCVKSMLIESDGVKQLSVHGSVDPDFSKFIKLGSYQSSSRKAGAESRIEVKLEKGNSVKFVQLRFEAASEPFIAVHKVNFEL